MVEAGGVYLRLSVDQVRLVPHVLVFVLLGTEPVHRESHLHIGVSSIGCYIVDGSNLPATAATRWHSDGG